MCVGGKSEVEACKTLIQCFNGTLARQWELESSPALTKKMEEEVLKDENGDIMFHPDGTPINNMIGVVIAMIFEHWCGTETIASDKNEIILMNLKCMKMSQYEDFHRDWMQRIFLVKDPKNLLWKQVYLAALPSKLVDFIKLQEFFQLPFETYTRGEIYSVITKALVSLCTRSKMNKYL